MLLENTYPIAEEEVPLSCRNKCQGGEGSGISCCFIQDHQECLTEKVPWTRDLTESEGAGHAEAWWRHRTADRTEGQRSGAIREH